MSYTYITNYIYLTRFNSILEYLINGNFTDFLSTFVIEVFQVYENLYCPYKPLSIPLNVYITEKSFYEELLLYSIVYY